MKSSKRSTKNDNFWGYAQKRIYGSMLDFLRSLDTVSRSDRKIIKEIEKIVVIYDDIALPFGEIKISFARGDGGHNGIKDITKKDTTGYICYLLEDRIEMVKV